MDESPYVDVGIIFETVRSQGRKLRWLADATGVSLSYVTKMQTGDRPARRDWANKAATALGLPTSLFLPSSSRTLDKSSRVNPEAA